MVGEALVGGGTVATLTFSDNRKSDEQLLKEWWQAEIERLLLRFSYHQGVPRLRYWLTAECGEGTERQHAHMIFFGTNLVHERTRNIDVPWWPYGHVMLDTASPQACKYIAGYLTKPEKLALKICHSKSKLLGELAFRAWCENVADEWDKWGARMLPESGLWAVNHQLYPMGKRFFDIYTKELGLPFRPSDKPGEARKLIDQGLSLLQVKWRMQDNYHKGILRSHEVEAKFATKDNVVSINGFLHKVKRNAR